MNASVESALQSRRLEYLQSRLQAKFQPLQLEIRDEGAQHIGHAHAGHGHYSVRIVATAFAAKDRLDRHRMIYAALGDLHAADIHALSIQALTPEESV